MKDKELTLKQIEASHTLGGTGDWCLYYSAVRCTTVHRSRVSQQPPQGSDAKNPKNLRA